MAEIPYRAPKQYQICLYMKEFYQMGLKAFNKLPTFIKGMSNNVKEFKLLL
jgi:hypothetical protein